MTEGLGWRISSPGASRAYDLEYGGIREARLGWLQPSETGDRSRSTAIAGQDMDGDKILDFRLVCAQNTY